MKLPVCVRIALAAAMLAVPWPQAGAQGTGTPLSVAQANAARLLPGITPDMVDSACRQGSVMLYTLIFGKGLSALSAQFHADFPCLELQTFSGSGGVLSQRFTSEFRGGVAVADLWMNSSPAFVNRVAKDGLLADWSPGNLDRIAEPWRHEPDCFPIGIANIGVAWNTASLSAAQRDWLAKLERWDQLPSAPFAGDSAMVDIRAGGTTQLPYYAFTKLYGPGFWEKFAALRPSMFSAINPLADRLTAGEFDFVIASPSDTAIGNQWERGATVQWTFPEPGLAVPYCIGLSSKAPHPDAAKLFLTWSLTRNAQAMWVDSTGLAPPGPDIPDRRRFAQEAWYKEPRTYYQADWDAIAAGITADTARFTSVFGH